MKITKTIANTAAHTLTKELVKKNNDAALQTIKTIEEHLISLLPKQVRDVFNSDNKNYLDGYHQVRLCGNGFNYEYINLTTKIAMLKNNINLPEDLAAVIRKQLDQQKKEEKRIEELVNEIALTLINLRTYKNVEENFKEAFEVLPPIVAKVPMKFDVKNILKQLK